MITQKEIIKASEYYDVPKSTIDKDWVLGHLLNALFSFDDIRNQFVFKGGTCLRKVHFDDYRFSEDLDFTLKDKAFIIDEKLIKRAMRHASSLSNARFSLAYLKPTRSEDEGQGYEIKIKFWGADHNPRQRPLPPARWQTSVKLDISYSESLLLKPEQSRLFHPYSDKEKIMQTVLAYQLEEILAEKLRSLIQRNRPRDIYDSWYLFKHHENINFREVKEALFIKSRNKGIEIESVNQFVNNKKREINRRAWNSSLNHQIPALKLPDFDNVYNDLEGFIINLMNNLS
ncbi:MAG: nucleotidyl transferase AbiEii/AbiGii toxin family protein [Bacteroidales bacterium]|nr:nucleotidyl transferase AbiEii/AbiGii toxin family protein [Bacteroidales bacterium]MCF8337674.1 nucleotidyl transferase AbiEii/AbiGii toxin family protein [Bacteroidales bacterium]